MKTFTSILILIFSVGVLPVSATSRVAIELLDHRQNMMIVFNGQRFTSTDNTMNVRGLTPGNYPIKVFRANHWGFYRAVFQGTIRVPYHSNVMATISHHGMQVRTEPLADGHGANYWDDDHHGQGNGHQQNPHGNGGFVSLQPIAS